MPAGEQQVHRYPLSPECHADHANHQVVSGVRTECHQQRTVEGFALPVHVGECEVEAADESGQNSGLDSERELGPGKQDRRGEDLNPMAGSEVPGDHDRKHLQEDRLDEWGQDDRSDEKRHRIDVPQDAGRAKFEHRLNRKEDPRRNQQALHGNAPEKLQLVPPPMGVEVLGDEMVWPDHGGQVTGDGDPPPSRGAGLWRGKQETGER